MTHTLVGKSYYYKEGKDFTFYVIVKAKNSKRSCGTKDVLLEIIDYKLDYEINELVETGSGMMWYSSCKEDLKPVTKTLYENICKNVKAKHKTKMRYLYKIEVK